MTQKLLATTDLRIVSMIEFRGKIYLATDHSVWVHDPDLKGVDFQEMILVEAKPAKCKPGVF